MMRTHHTHSAAALVLTIALLACTREAPLPISRSESPVMTAAGGRAALARTNMHPGCAEHFASFDDNGDSRVSQDEFNARPHADPDPVAVFQGRDSDGDGSLSETEFCSGWRGASRRADARRPNAMPATGMGLGRRDATGHRRMGGPMMGMRCEQHFDAFDANRDGNLTIDEFAAWPHMRGDAETLFGERDRDHDGTITGAEFCSM